LEQHSWQVSALQAVLAFLLGFEVSGLKVYVCFLPWLLTQWSPWLTLLFWTTLEQHSWQVRIAHFVLLDPAVLGNTCYR
jgi:hypothetical protein